MVITASPRSAFSAFQESSSTSGDFPSRNGVLPSLWRQVMEGQTVPVFAVPPGSKSGWWDRATRISGARNSVVGS
jgi:hypothetical protein